MFECQPPIAFNQKHNQCKCACVREDYLKQDFVDIFSKLNSCLHNPLDLDICFSCVLEDYLTALSRFLQFFYDQRLTHRGLTHRGLTLMFLFQLFHSNFSSPHCIKMSLCLLKYLNMQKLSHSSLFLDVL